MTRATLRSCLVVFLLIGCGEEEAAPPPAAAPVEPSVQLPIRNEAEPEQAAEPSSPAPEDVAGLQVTIAPEGTIRVAGADRWGADISTTYESWQYLRDAMPTLERSITPEQVTALRAFVDEHAPPEAAAE